MTEGGKPPWAHLVRSTQLCFSTRVATRVIPPREMLQAPAAKDRHWSLLLFGCRPKPFLFGCRPKPQPRSRRYASSSAAPVSMARPRADSRPCQSLSAASSGARPPAART